ncbi:MAG: four helix bundle protein [Pseudomonadota bacterium]
MESYRRLLVWQKAMDLAEGIYRLAGSFPQHELYGLTSQIRRAAVSIPSNIAEGRERGSDKDFMRFLGIALGSLAELETQLLLSQRLGYVAEADLQSLVPLADEVGKMLRGLKRSLEQPGV